MPRMISETSLEAMRCRMPDILGHYGIYGLTRNFSSPWREDSSPSCAYYADSNLVHDFGEGSTVDVFGLVGRTEGISDFPGQAREVARILGCSMDESALPAPKPKRPRFDPPIEAGLGYDAMETAQAAFFDLYEPEGAPAREYLHSRGFDDADAVRYGLGFARTPRAMGKAFTAYEPNAPLGYLSLPFPSDASFSRVHYMMLRAVPGARPPERKEIRPTGCRSPLFHEHMLSASLPVLYIAEGILDAMAMEKMLSRPCVGLGGASMARRAGRVLAAARAEQRPGKVILAPDADEAGRKAAEAIEADLVALGIPCSVLDMPEGCKDPADVLLMYGGA